MNQLDVQQCMSRAWAAKEAGHVEEAESLLADVIRQDPLHLPALMAVAILAVETSRPDLAIHRFEEVLKRHEDCVPALVWLATLLPGFGRVEEAARYADLAIRLAPDDPRVMMAKAKTLLATGNSVEASRILQRVVAVQPKDSEALYELGGCLLRMNRDYEAADAFRAAVRLAPELAGYLALVELTLNLGLTEEALGWARQALQMAPTDPLAAAALARALVNKLEFEEAEAWWAKSVELGMSEADMRYKRAIAYKVLHRNEQVIEDLRSSIAADPGQGKAYAALFFFRKAEETDRGLIASAEAIANSGRLGGQEEIDLRYGLGKARNDLGEFEAAMREFDEANRLNRRQMGNQPFNALAFREQVKARIRMYTKSALMEASSSAKDTATPIFVVGMMRSGTTLVEQILTCHPEIGGVGEQPFWASVENEITDFTAGRLNMPALKVKAEEYGRLLQKLCPGKHRVVDKNPANVLAAGLARLAMPSARIICIRRHPVDTALSIWMTPMRTSAAFISDKDAIVSAYQECAALMDHWREAMPKDHYLEVGYEDLVENRGPITSRMIDFCGVGWDDACMHPENSLREVRTPSLWQVRKPVYRSSVGRWRNYLPWLGPFRQLIPKEKES